MARTKQVAPKPAPKAAKRKAKQAPAPAPKVPARKRKAVATPPAAPAVDPLDLTPTTKLPAVYLAKLGRGVNRSCIAYKRTATHVHCVMFDDDGKRVLVRRTLDEFDAHATPALFPHLTGEPYSVRRALQVFLKPHAVFEEAAWRVLNRLQQGKDPDVADPMEELLDMTPTPQRATRKRSRDMSIMAKDARRKRRQAKLAAMSPVQLKAFRAAKNARRKARKLARQQGE